MTPQDFTDRCIWPDHDPREDELTPDDECQQCEKAFPREELNERGYCSHCAQKWDGTFEEDELIPDPEEEEEEEMENPELLNVVFDDDEYDRVLAASRAQASPITVIVKENATTGGRAGVLISFAAEFDGKIFLVQATTTARLFTQAAAAVAARTE